MLFPGRFDGNPALLQILDKGRHLKGPRGFQSNLSSVYKQRPEFMVFSGWAGEARELTAEPQLVQAAGPPCTAVATTCHHPN